MGMLQQRWLSLMVIVLVLTVGGMGLHLTAFAYANSGSTILVTTPLDVVADDGLCSLREAVQSANTNLPSGTEVGECIGGDTQDVIQFSPDFITFTLTISGAYEDANLSGDFDVLDSVIIHGNGITQTILDGSSIDRVFHVVTGTVLIEDLAITNGRPPAVTFGENLPGSGGAIYNETILTLERVALYENHAGALISIPPFERIDAGHGGAIASTYDLRIQSSLVYSNISGEIISAELGEGIHVTGSGGGIYNSGDLFISDTHIFNNRTPNGAEGLEVGGFGGNGGGLASFGPTSIYNTGDVKREREKLAQKRKAPQGKDGSQNQEEQSHVKYKLYGRLDDNLLCGGRVDEGGKKGKAGGTQGATK